MTHNFKKDIKKKKIKKLTLYCIVNRDNPEANLFPSICIFMKDKKLFFFFCKDTPQSFSEVSKIARCHVGHHLNV